MIPLYASHGFKIAWVWIHGNECRGGAYRPVFIDVRIRPVSDALQTTWKQLPELRRKVLTAIRRYPISLIRRMIAAMREAK